MNKAIDQAIMTYNSRIPIDYLQVVDWRAKLVNWSIHCNAKAAPSSQQLTNKGFNQLIVTWNRRIIERLEGMNNLLSILLLIIQINVVWRKYKNTNKKQDKQIR